MKEYTRPKRALLAYCALAQRLNTQGIGIMQALTPFLGVACVQFAGELFDAAKFSAAIEAHYGITIPRLAALGLTEQLCDAGILEIVSDSSSSIVYRYTKKSSGDEVQAASPLTEAEVEKVLQSFSVYCSADQQLAIKDRATLDAAFLDRLLNIDSMKLLSRRDASIAVKKPSILYCLPNPMGVSALMTNKSFT